MLDSGISKMGKRMVQRPGQQGFAVLGMGIKKVRSEEVRTIRILIGTDLEVGQRVTKIPKEITGKSRKRKSTNERAHCPATHFLEAVSAVP